MRLINAVQRKDGKILVSLAFDSGRVIKKILTPEQYTEAKARESVQLTKEEIRERAIPFGQPGYRG